LSGGKYDAAWIAAYTESREFFEVATVAMFTACDAQKQVTAAALADAVLDTLAPQHATIDPLIAGAARATLIKLAERILEASPAAHEPN
jgi:hypothetical protein